MPRRANAEKTYVVTSAQYCARVNREFLGSLETYCKKHNAELLILPMNGRTYVEDELDFMLSKYDIVTKDRKLNDKIRISEHRVLPQQIDPVTGLGRFTQYDVSTIFASPKQRLKVVPNANTSLPKVLMTTGSVTHPNYNTGNRIGVIALRDHVYGAIVVEVVDDRTYHYRFLTAGKNGSFVDLKTEYGVDKIDEASLEALVLGDWHTGDTDAKVREATFDIIKELHPKRIFLHDFFNGHSVNWWMENRSIQQAKAHRLKRMNLADELKQAYEELMRICSVVEGGTEVYIITSNHDERLKQYLDEGRYLKHPENLYISVKLAANVIDGKNALREGMAIFGRIPGNVKFIERDDDYKVRGWQLGAHGDRGPSGFGSSTRTKENSYGRSITGHSHTPEILRGTIVVGTSTELQLDYNKGQPSSWMNTHALLYDNGKVQLVNIIDGQWRRK